MCSRKSSSFGREIPTNCTGRRPGYWSGRGVIGRRRDYRAVIERGEEHPDAPRAHDAALGAALRRIRNSRGLSLAQVAEATGVSRSLLSLIETGRSDITVGRLSRLARLYDVRLADLVPEPRHPDPLVVRADDRRSLHYDAEGIDVEILIPEGPHGMQALLTTLPPHAAMQDFIVQPNEVFVFVLQGRIRTEFGDGRVLELAEGDSAAFVSGEAGHRHRNLADTVSRIVVVIRRPHPR